MSLKIGNIVERELIVRFINGDMKAFDDIYSTFDYKLQKFIFSLVKTKADTEDLVHEVFVKVWENKQKLRNPESFDSYLFSIAYNTTVSFLRSKAKNTEYIEYVKSVQIDIDEAEVLDGVNIEAFNEKLNLLVENLPPRQREVFKMKHFKNYSYKEIAETLGISVNTVENHIVKAHKYLKENLGEAYLSLLLFLYLFL
ncbi:RNA polymerase sigma factor [Sunxiuqinia rutila]|uniref:RNA polymerase sigma factor n=1 Tax=Sunxiuqinia rutila TaxID=1397841 RepID=UPI003D363646